MDDLKPVLASKPVKGVGIVCRDSRTDGRFSATKKKGIYQFAFAGGVFGWSTHSLQVSTIEGNCRHTRLQSQHN
jgi:hypothetical protein